RRLVGDGEHLRTHGPARHPRHFETEDGGPDLANGGVEIIDRLLDAFAHHIALDVPLHALQVQTHREQTLDHGVVQVAGDALAVFHDHEIAGPRVQPRVLDGDAGGRGQGRNQLLVDV